MISAALPGLIKIGVTTLDPITRAKQLTAATASPTPFTVAYSRYCSDANEVEAAMHEAFDHCRVTARREFFQVSLAAAICELDRLVPVEYVPPAYIQPLPWSDLFASFEPSTSNELNPTEIARCRALAATLRAAR